MAAPFRKPLPHFFRPGRDSLDMQLRSLTQFSLARPRLIFALVLLITLAFLAQLPKIQTNTNPKNMLPPTSEVRVWNDSVDRTFALYEDTIVVGIVHPASVLNTATLEKVRDITAGILRIKGVAGRDVSSFTTIDNVTAAGPDLKVAPLVTKIPKNEAELQALRQHLFENPLFVDRIISRDEKTTAIYVPLEKGANGKEAADRIREILAGYQGEEQYYVAGDPVARDTFGAEMFKLMGIFSPIAGMIMFIVIYAMFRSLAPAATMMLVAMVAIIWTMGLGIGLGFPIHIMSSMAPVFLMAIATDSIHIFNEFSFRLRESKDKRTAIIETMAAVSRPVRYTALATAAGFAVLLFMQSVPVKVFGGLIVFGTLVLRLLSFSLIPAILTFVREEKIVQEEIVANRTLQHLGAWGARRPKTAVAISAVMIALALFGMSHIAVNNNMVAWFKPGSEIRNADAVINRALGGTSLGYVVVSTSEPEAIKQPQTLRYIEGLQRHLEQLPVVGKTSSVADYVKRINRVLHDDDPRFDTVPDEADTIAQYLFLFSMSAKPSDLDNVVDYPFQQANVWVQLKSWDAAAMASVIQSMQEYQRAYPANLELRPAGIAYFNFVWNHEVLWDMVKGFVLALAVVLLILIFNFRSLKWALVGYVPLLFTILIIYGAVGFAGKDFDMPISVLSCLSLGMAVDFSIHFISRLRQRLAETGVDAKHDLAALREALVWTAARPGKGIMRNAILFAAAFSVMLFAPLTPYITVGAFIVAMMLFSALFTLLYLPALIVLMRGWLFTTGVTK
ncbi:MAG: MMPL family transporter [Nitrospirae bacterium]|nr:MMPL family transporter [Nitrospirota bacterium]